MRRRPENTIGRRLLNDVAALENGDTVGDARNKSQIVRDIKRGDARFRAQVAE